MYANLFGDFVKGSDLSRFNNHVQYGIKLHRFIDHFIDHHPAVLELLHKLYPKLPRISSVAVDLYFDHLLASNWSEFHELPYDQFLQNFYDSQLEDEKQFTREFLFMMDRLKSRNWMHYYQFKDGLNKACHGVSSRISFENNLHEGLLVFEELEAEITGSFYEFMPDAKQKIQEFHASNGI